MLQIILLEMKDFVIKNTKIFMLSAIAFLLSCIAVNITLTNFVMVNQEQIAMEESYGNKCYYKINLNGDEEVFSNFFGGENAEKIKNAFEQLKTEKYFDYRYGIENGIEFFSMDDPTYGKDNFPKHPQECIYGYEEGEPKVYEDYLQLKSIFADHLFKTEPNIKLSEGKWFDDKDFYVDSLEDIHLPVILGSEYKNYYKVGDTLTNAHIATEQSITLEVIGFFERDSFFYDNNNDKILLNRYMVVPSVETTYDYITKTGEIDPFFKYAYDSTKIMNARIVCKEEDAEKVKEIVRQVFMENQLYELRLVDESDGTKKALEDSRNIAWSSFIISIFVIIFSTIVYGIQMYYKILQNKRKYCVFQLNGITRRQIFLLTLTDNLSVFILADLLFIIFWTVNASRGFEGLGLTIWQFAVIPLMEIFILLLMGIMGIKRIKHLDMSSVLRENE